MVGLKSIVPVALLGVSLFVLVVVADEDGEPAFLMKIPRQEIFKACEKDFATGLLGRWREHEYEECDKCCKRAGSSRDGSKMNSCHCVKPPSKFAKAKDKWVKDRAEAAKRQREKKEAEWNNSAKSCTKIKLILISSDSQLKISEDKCTSCCTRFGVEKHIWKKSNNAEMECHCGSQGCSLKQWFTKTGSAACAASEEPTVTSSQVQAIE
jgi:hypothetical protein